jgi:hypothetical protein
VDASPAAVTAIPCHTPDQIHETHKGNEIKGHHHDHANHAYRGNSYRVGDVYPSFRNGSGPVNKNGNTL